MEKRRKIFSFVVMVGEVRERALHFRGGGHEALSSLSLSFSSPNHQLEEKTFFPQTRLCPPASLDDSAP